ncbi:hypothetical protein [Sphingomicrobium clamense]|uniref:Uncharacterized protein n=1 Tax=Sphingomicrobium clamense TaxID=2851013 RepID=A0ABS6V5U6_9SPHN|nr:hypothetical protein [Sphingomicrobium sp. B8]MBW0144916.1 hypothetical protein [Sphingomicrobium sp. B8]
MTESRRKDFAREHPILNGLVWGVLFFLVMNFLRPLVGRPVEGDAQLALGVGAIVGGFVYGVVMMLLSKPKDGDA